MIYIEIENQEGIMTPFSKIGIEEIKFLANCLLENRATPEFIIKEFGIISMTNGYGTTFLTPHDPLFKTFSIHEKEGRANSISFGGPKLGLTLFELLSTFNFHTEQYSRYDDAYEYYLYENVNSHYTIEIFSKTRLFDGEKDPNDIEVGGITIALK